MQEYVKIKTDRQTSDLLKQVSSAIEDAITESLSDLEIKENLEAIISIQNTLPDVVLQLKEHVLENNTKAKELSDNNLSQVVSKNEETKKQIIDKIVSVSDENKKQSLTLTDINFLQKEIEKKTISNHDYLSEKVEKIITIESKSTQELLVIKEQIILNNNKLIEFINSIKIEHESVLKRIEEIELFQNKPWYKKIFK